MKARSASRVIVFSIVFLFCASLMSTAFAQSRRGHSSGSSATTTVEVKVTTRAESSGSRGDERARGERRRGDDRRREGRRGRDRGYDHWEQEREYGQNDCQGRRGRSCGSYEYGREYSPRRGRDYADSYDRHEHYDHHDHHGQGGASSPVHRAEAIEACGQVADFSSDVDFCIQRVPEYYTDEAEAIVRACGSATTFSSDFQACLSSATRFEVTPVGAIQACGEATSFSSHFQECLSSAAAYQYDPSPAIRACASATSFGNQLSSCVARSR